MSLLVRLPPVQKQGATAPGQPHGLLLVCEVSTGVARELVQADPRADKLPKGRETRRPILCVLADLMPKTEHENLQLKTLILF